MKPHVRHERLNKRGGQMLVTRFLHWTPVVLTDKDKVSNKQVLKRQILVKRLSQQSHIIMFLSINFSLVFNGCLF